MLFAPPKAQGIIWDGASYDPQNLLGAKPAEALSSHAPGFPTLGTGLIPGSGSSLDRGDRPWHPDSPLFWFGMLAAVTFGLIGASTAVRVGPFKAGVSAGKT